MKDINQIAQNKPSLIAKDLALHGVPYDTSMSILLERGVFKWLAIRRKIIKQKNIWKERICNTLAGIAQAKKRKDIRRLYYLRGYLKAYEECRKEVREMCHGTRLQAPDFDNKAVSFLGRYKGDSNVLENSL